MAPFGINQLFRRSILAELILLPWDMDEPFGHSDGMIAWLGDNRILLNNYHQLEESKCHPFTTRIYKILRSQFDIMELEYNVKPTHNSWCYLNYLETDDAPVFPKVWAQIEPLIQGLPLVAHNKPFDEGCLKAVFRVYQMDYPDYEFYDTLCVSRRVLPGLENHQLQTVAAACGYELEDHHHALADAEACAWIAREIL